MNKCMRVFLVGSIFIITFVVSFSLFLNESLADPPDPGEYVWFRIDSELDALIADKGTLTIRWYCTGATTFGEVNDGTASESTNSADGIVKVASGSKEMTDASCTIGATDTLRASASIDGWVVRTWTAASFPGASTSDPFTTRASLDYAFVVNGAKDELGNTFTMTGTSTSTTTTASASYSGTYASSSYSGNKWYVAPTGDGNIAAGKDGYVKKTEAVTWLGDYKTASYSADFGLAAVADYDGDALQFGVKVNLDKADRTGKTYSNVAGATVTAGDSLGVSCTDNNDGDYYCAVPLAHTELLASADSIPVGGQSENVSCTYTDRTAGGNVQSTCTISANEPSAGGGGGGNPYVAVTTPTPTPSLSPTPTPILSPTPTPTPVSAILYRKANDPKVYVQGSDGTLTWVKTIEEFNAAGYRWSDVKMISGSEFAQMKISDGTMPITRALYKKVNDPKVYVQGSDGTLTWVKTIEAFNTAGYSWSNVKSISGTEFAQMKVNGNAKVVKGIGFLRVRSGPSITDKVVGQVLPDQELKFTEINNGWYHINSGWVSGAYVKEF